MSKTIKAACLVLVLGLVGCGQSEGPASVNGVLLERKFINIGKQSKIEITSFLNALDQECELPGNGEFVLRKYSNQPIKNMIKPTYWAEVEYDLSSYQCLHKRLCNPERCENPTRYSRASSRSKLELVRGKFDNVEWEEEIINFPYGSHGPGIVGGIFETTMSREDKHDQD